MGRTLAVTAVLAKRHQQRVRSKVILVFGGGLIGTSHHWYFAGQTELNMALYSTFSVGLGYLVDAAAGGRGSGVCS